MEDAPWLGTTIIKIFPRSKDSKKRALSKEESLKTISSPFQDILERLTKFCEEINAERMGGATSSPQMTMSKGHASTGPSRAPGSPASSSTRKDTLRSTGQSKTLTAPTSKDKNSTKNAIDAGITLNIFKDAQAAQTYLYKRQFFFTTTQAFSVGDLALILKQIAGDLAKDLQ